MAVPNPHFAMVRPPAPRSVQSAPRASDAAPSKRKTGQYSIKRRALSVRTSSASWNTNSDNSSAVNGRAERRRAIRQAHQTIATGADIFSRIHASNGRHSLPASLGAPSPV